MVILVEVWTLRERRLACWQSFCIHPSKTKQESRDFGKIFACTIQRSHSHVEKNLDPVDFPEVRISLIKVATNYSLFNESKLIKWVHVCLNCFIVEETFILSLMIIIYIILLKHLFKMAKEDWNLFLSNVLSLFSITTWLKSWNWL